MSRKVSTADPRPPYVQIADDLRAAIDDGKLTPGERLPSGRELAAEYGVAAMTIQHAVRLLREEGRLQTWQGRGVFVTPASGPNEVPMTDTQDEILRRLTQLGREVEQLRRRVSVLEKR